MGLASMRPRRMAAENRLVRNGDCLDWTGAVLQ